MTITLRCGQCGGELLAEQPGSLVACPHCGTALQVPGAFPATENVEIKQTLPPNISAHINRQEPASTLNQTTHYQNSTPVVSRFWFLMLLSYASAITLAFFLLLYLLSQIQPHALESLPDIVPKIQNGEIGLRIAPPEANVAPGHALKLGETQRYGSLLVTPLRVTEGPLQFEGITPGVAPKAMSAPVWKLWLRFENVSRNQTFPPLDTRLLFHRYYNHARGDVATNQFLYDPGQRQSEHGRHFLYEFPIHSEYQLQGQKLNSVLSPGQRVEIYVPSAEQIQEFSETMVWRVQFRKGYHPTTFHGVTTLIDVQFQKHEVQLESSRG